MVREKESNTRKTVLEELFTVKSRGQANIMTCLHTRMLPLVAVKGHVPIDFVSVVFDGADMKFSR